MLRKIVLLSAIFVLISVGCMVPCRAAEGADAAPNLHAAYKLGSGDKLRINIYGQTELNGEYTVDATGNVQLPLVGEVHAADKTIAEFQKEVTAKLSEGYFVNPNVSVDVVNYRPFYIIGQVAKPGEYAYVNGMSILNAVALAGGYSDRADESEAYLRRNGSTKEVQVPADETSKVMPGDIIRIPERYF